MADLPAVVLTLQEKYTSLCSEKCRLLNRIESTNRESRHLSRSNKRTLDILAEFMVSKSGDVLAELSEDDLETDVFLDAQLNLRQYQQSRSLVGKAFLSSHTGTEAKRAKRSKKRKIADRKEEEAAAATAVAVVLVAEPEPVLQEA